ncbi:MAG TPA: FtsK/SpoIIIE domain-containing protein [Actinocrinis sp.]
MAPAARAADSVWNRLGRGVAESAPASWLNANVLNHPGVSRTRGVTGRAWVRVLDVCYPLIVLGRGARRGLALILDRWKGDGKEKRRIEALVAVACVVAVALIHYGPLLLFLGAVGACAWLGRDTSRRNADPEAPTHITRLQAVYNGLVPYLQNGDDPDQHFKPGGGYRDAFTAWAFDEQDRLVHLRLDYSEYVKDGLADCRAQVERAIEGKVGQSNEYLYDWDEQGNHLDVRILPPLTAGIGIQPWPVADIEFVLGITDPGSSGRLIPVLVPDGAEAAAEPAAGARDASGAAPPGFRVEQLAPVIWRVASTDPHLLVAGGPGTGKSTALRSLAAQALASGHRIAVLDTGRCEHYAGLGGRPGVLRVAEDARAWLDLIDWFGAEVEQRALRMAPFRHAAAAQRPALPAPAPEPVAVPTPGVPVGIYSDESDDTQTRLKPVEGLDPAAAVPSGLPGTPGAPEAPAAPVEPHLWLLVDDVSELAEAAASLDRPDPLDVLAAAARKARFAQATVVVAAPTDKLSELYPLLLGQLTARVALGRVDPAASTLLFGGTLELGGAAVMPRGRGYAQIGLNGPVIRLQAPYAPTLAPTAV